MKKRYLSFIMSLMMLLTSGCKSEEVVVEYPQEIVSEVDNVDFNTPPSLEVEEVKEEVVEPEEIINPVVTKDIIISAVGDCTLGNDPNFGYARSLPSFLEQNNNDYSYFFSGVYDILSNDSLTIANLENAFTDSNNRRDKKFTFKASGDYANILTSGSVEAVNIANNHSRDYGEKGFEDTKEALESLDIPYFGYEDYVILDIDGISIGLAGLTAWGEGDAIANTDKAISYFKEQNTDLIIMTYHWGIEREYKQSKLQENVARHAIEAGADLVLGHHPHVLQGIECYQGKYIVYSLGNFVFGGNKNPSDKDTMIFRQTFHYENDELVNTSIEIIPCSLSSVSNYNDFKPVPLEGEEKERVLKKVLTNSKNLEYEEE